MRRVLAQALKELKHLRRDPLTMALSVLMPLVMVWLFGTTLSLDPDNIKLVVDDLDHTPLSRRYLETYATSNDFILVGRPSGVSVMEALDTNRATAGLVIPAGFERNVRRGTSASVQLLIDGSDANTAVVLRQSARALHQAFLAGLAPAGPSPGLVQPRIRYWHNPGLSDRIFFGTGALGMVLIFFPSLLGAIATSREHELGTIVQVYSSTLRASEWIAGKALPYIAVGCVQFVLCFSMGMALFSYRIPSDPLPLLLATVLYIAGGVLFGMGVGNQTKSQSASIQFVQMGIFLLSMLLSGFLTPVENIPVQLRWISYLIPTRYYIDIVRDALLRDGSWPTEGAAVAVLGVLVVGAFAANLLKMRRMRFED